jgi:hypothetical protein
VVQDVFSTSDNAPVLQYLKLKLIVMKIVSLLLLVISTNSIFGQIPQNFETWDTTYQHIYQNGMENEFDVQNPKHGIVKDWNALSDYGVSQTTDSYSGNYAIILHNWYSYATSTIETTDSISFRPTYLQGYFKYITTSYDGLSNGIIDLFLTNNNGLDTVGIGSFQFDSTLAYTPFQIKINYLSLGIPDSAKIIITNSDSHCKINIFCNLLYLDDLAFSENPLSVESYLTSNAKINVYPNPTSGVLNFGQKVEKVELYNLSGDLVKRWNYSSDQIDISLLHDGLYLLKIIRSDHLIVTQKIMKY